MESVLGHQTRDDGIYQYHIQWYNNAVTSWADSPDVKASLVVKEYCKRNQLPAPGTERIITAAVPKTRKTRTEVAILPNPVTERPVNLNLTPRTPEKEVDETAELPVTPPQQPVVLPRPQRNKVKPTRLA